MEEEGDEEEENEYEEMSDDDVMESANSLDSIIGTNDYDLGDESFDTPG
eukprot:CAMPEP_0172565146 /NCGR_PEP_ID=MMETSP1067-20121228/107122_1 /TAXON_ID=265564 ORGANISM="Thalassiosira punctigera, Strain Tpunct2005C2" /NCGR_SAMPLE_ID=MMETSP1067 /ASSEMBLY_ACC=CAM_ASM_000444 /LENGTH=48 /DNA_ID= /DNA_START= /DNA_END= /DNA_ORIENTATION=